MQLGWIDFSPSDREKALGVLDLLSDHDQEHDPLGISSVERAFARFFFPGISTQLTRAKYFILVPCQMIWLYENSGGMDKKAINKKIADMEKTYTKALKENASENDTGIIGRDSCDGDGWVMRPPSSRYWTSLKEYKIFKEDKTFTKYKELVRGESKTSTPGWTEYWNDKDGKLKKIYGIFSKWYNSKPDENSDTELAQWYKEVSIKLTTNEGDFLKNQITDSYPCSLLAIILEKKAFFSKFADLKDFIEQDFVDKEIKDCYKLALAFSDFIIVARTLYNIIINEDKSYEDKLLDLLDKKPMSARANIDIDVLLEKAEIRDGSLKEFLEDLREAMQDGNIEKMKELIENREKAVVGVARAKTAKAGKIEKKWYGGKELEYRFNVAKNIINDIFESEGNENAGS